MSSSELIALAAVAVPSGTALLVAYWHRKQMRQIEEFDTQVRHLEVTERSLTKEPAQPLRVTGGK